MQRLADQLIGDVRAVEIAGIDVIHSRRDRLAQVSVYIASKHAVEGLTKSVALEFAKQNIRINAIAPGVIATEMFDRFAGDELRDQIVSIVPVGRVGASDEIAAAVLYLASDAAKFTTGTSLVVDGGFIAG